MKFPYQKLPPSQPNAPWILKPLLKVQLSHENKSINVNALIDSGADASLFHSSIAHELGIDLQSGMKQEFLGISGHKITAYLHLVKLDVVGGNNPMEVAVAFTDSPGVGALLGQTDFFQRNVITFARHKEEIEIKPVKKK